MHFGLKSNNVLISFNYTNKKKKKREENKTQTNSGLNTLQVYLFL